ncbi:MAG: HU family DNA-binding protein [Duncaniella sp.]|uniref:HU family DNA-binding protein n=1 Tax=Duncaniella sp. TaxID=2518496 RepID=UPI0023BCCB1D|nr:HU family DNA-binding protein [Duncaniella sp.]MDE5987921.1 HU family DNA-binding protein [Duncaniella sp.]
MDNKQFISRLGKRLNRESSEVATLVEGLCKVFKECGTDLDSIAIPGFGTFKSVKTDEIIVFDETTGKRTLVPPAIRMEFAPSIVLRKKMTKQ